MSGFPIKKTKEEKRAPLIGAAMAAAVHIFSLFLLFSTGFRTVYPPPQETGIEVQFEMEPPKPVMVQSGTEPRTEKPDPDKEIRLVQQSKSAITGSKANKGSEATTGDFGDVEKYEPQRKPIDKRALFPSAANGDSTAPQVAKRVSEDLSAGHPEGNTKTGSTEGEPSARLAGRTVMGTLPEPEYTVNKAGKVVVKISVDQYGSVISATPGATGTTVQDKILWDAAKKAALKAKFNLSSSAPAVQEGTITYIFRLK